VRAAVTCALITAFGAAGVACSDDAGPDVSAEADRGPVVSIDAPLLGQLPRVDLIDDAIAAVDAERGAATAFFEINATPLLVNLFADNGDGTTTPYVFVDGQLSSQASLSGATGGNFPGSAAQFNPDTLLSAVVAELPGSSIEVATLLGNGTGAVQYGVGVRSAAGGQLLVVVSAEGDVLSVEAIGADGTPTETQPPTS
jgi:hypothetical protein